MRMNTSIPMQGQMPDLVNALARGHTAGRSRREADLYNEHGAGIAAGNQDSMNALAQFDPRLALGAQGARQDMSAQSQRMQALTAQQQRAGTLFDQGQQDRQAASKAEAAYKQTENAINVINSAQSPEQWDQFARIYGSPELVGQFGNKAALLAKLLPVKDQLAMQIEAERANAPDYTVVDGQYFDQNNPGGGAQPVPGFTPQEKGPLVDMSGANFGPQDAGVTDKFYENLDGKSADMFAGLLDNGMTAPTRLAQVDELDRLLSASPSGAEAALKNFAGNYGIETEGLSNIQTASAIINRLVPAQREPGSGPMSDRDLEMFKQSLPRLINTPEGNRQIVNTMRGLIVYEAKQSEIARRVQARQITPAEGMKALSELENPLQVQSKPGDVVTIGGYTIEVVE